MLRTIVIALALLIAAPSAALAFGFGFRADTPEKASDQVAIQDTAGTCTTPGTIIFPDLPDARAEIYPSVHRELVSIGRMAKANGCTVEVTCVSAEDADNEARAARNRQCRSAAQSIVRHEQRSSVRSRLLDEIVQTRAKANEDLIAGAVYVTLR